MTTPQPTLLFGDCIASMRKLPDCSVDAIVTDPPYGLSFMSKKWDYDVPSVEVWAECLRVLKPGGHLLAFAGTRTQHRMAVRIEDAGFEIRDMIAWCYGSGFPKSHNLDNLRGDKICGCSDPYTQQDGTEPPTECELRPVRGFDVPATEPAGEECGQVLQSGVQEQGASARQPQAADEARTVQPGMEGWGDAPEAPRQLCASSVHPGASLGDADGASGRLRDGAPAGDGALVRLPADADGSGAPHGPRSAAQRADELGIVAGQSKPQAVGAWPVCRGCGLPVVPRGLGTALKPALEPITVARKPLVGTVAANVLEHGTGALNIDGCRVGTEGGCRSEGGDARTESQPGAIGSYASSPAVAGLGRWPANLILDGSDEVLAAFPQTGPSPKSYVRCEASGNVNAYGSGIGDAKGALSVNYGDTGSAARFFYCAKASKRDRGEGNAHPTVKPTDLMRYLCRLVTPPGGVVLDPFMGSGSTGVAAILEGFRFTGCERDLEYFSTAWLRVELAVAARQGGTK